MESIQVADTIEGDVVAFHPANRRQIIVLPRGEDRLHARGPDLLETINWVCSVIGEVGPRRYFEPLDSRLESDMTPALMPVAPDRGATAQALGQLPREVLMSYFAELRAVEEWALAKAGGPEAFSSDFPPFFDDEDLIALSEAVHARYCTHRLASALRGASVTVSATPKHDPSAIRVVEERQVSPDRVVIQTAEGTDFVYARQYVLERAADEWRISSRTDLVQEDSEA